MPLRVQKNVNERRRRNRTRLFFLVSFAFIAAFGYIFNTIKFLSYYKRNYSNSGEPAEIDEPEVVHTSQENDASEQTSYQDQDGIISSHGLGFHSSFPLTCGEVPNHISPALTNILDIMQNNPEKLSQKHSVNFNKMNHGKYKNEESLYQKQVCSYDVLARWNDLARHLGITQWVTHGGSSIGAKCFGGMNPWDDDIDITILDCEELDKLWETSDSNISHHYPTLDPNSHSMKTKKAVYWDSRLISNDLILSKGSTCCDWYKLMTVKEAFMWHPGMDIGGMDMECMSRKLSSRELSAQRKSKWIDHMKSKNHLYTVPYGPTTIQTVPPDMLDQYIKHRYGKKSPCQFPFGDGIKPELIVPLRPKNEANNETVINIFQPDIIQASLNFALEHWYIPKSKRDVWRKQAGNKKQMKLTAQIPNLDTVEIDNSISPGCTWGSNSTIKVIGWNAERGGYWDKFSQLIEEQDYLKQPLVILLNEMDVGMARSGNVHTARRLALQLGMNYAYGVEFVELTRGTKAEQEATQGQRDALSLHGNAILSKCILGDVMILRDALPHTYFSNQAHRGINADGFEVRLGGRMGLFARIFEKPSPIILAKWIPQQEQDNYKYLEKLSPHFVVGNVHKVEESKSNRDVLWSYYGFGSPPITNSTFKESKYEGGIGINIPSLQLGVIIQGDFGPRFCSLGGLEKMNNYKTDKTFRVKCLLNRKVKIGPLSGDFFCSNMKMVRPVKVTPPCDWQNTASPLTLADHAIVSIVVQGDKK